MRETYKGKYENYHNVLHKLIHFAVLPANDILIYIYTHTHTYIHREREKFEISWAAVKTNFFTS